MSSSQVNLTVDWCGYKAARYAVENWHYSRSLPAGKTAKIGVWENDTFVGVFIFSLGANKLIGSPYGCGQFEAVELTRVALKDHAHPVSEMCSKAISLLQGKSPRLRLIVSYADANEGHHGGIYQAGNWLYVGKCATERGIRVHGKIVHRRTLSSNYSTSSIEWICANVDPEAEIVRGQPKHKYLYPLDRAMRRQIEPLSQPYPKRADVGEMESRVTTSD